MVDHDGIRLGKLMARAGVNATGLAEALDVSDTAVGKWLRTGAIARERITGICRALGCSSDELLGLVELSEPGKAEPRRIFTKERRASDDVVALQIGLSALAAALLKKMPGSAAEFDAALAHWEDAFSFSGERGFLSRLSGIAHGVRHNEEAEDHAPLPADPAQRTKRGR